MKKMTLISLLMALMPFIVMAQSNDDLYFIPKKKAEKKPTMSIFTSFGHKKSFLLVLNKKVFKILFSCLS